MWAVTISPSLLVSFGFYWLLAELPLHHWQVASHRRQLNEIGINLLLAMCALATSN
jgi:hypothetical protein